MEKSMGEKIRELREKNKMTLEQVGEIVGVGKSTVRKWETGMIENMRRDKIAKLAKALHTTPAYLMGWTDDISDTSQNVIEDNTLFFPIMKYYNLLNEAGKSEATKRVKELTYIPMYQLSSSDDNQYELLAAHKRTDIEVSADDISHDIDIMKDDSEWDD